MAWGDDMDDSDDDEPQQQVVVVRGGGTVGAGSSNVSIPPTHKSRIDSKGIQIVTSYRKNKIGQLIKTVTKIHVSMVKVKEPAAIQERRLWKKFGQAAKDATANVSTTVQSKDEIVLDDPHADTDLQEDDPTSAISGNLNAFWAKQQRRQLERKYDVAPGSSLPEDATGGDALGGGGGGGWTQVGAGGSTAAGSGGGGGGVSKYIPPSARAAAAAGGGGGAGTAGSGLASAGFKPDRRNDDLNTIRVTNLSGNTTEADLQDLFSRFGRISRVYLAKDKETFQSRGFAFVSFINKDDAATAMDALQGFGYDHLILKLEWARPNAPKDPASSGTEFRSGYGKALAQDTKEKVSYASNLTK